MAVRTLSYDEAAKIVRNRLRSYSAVSIVRLALVTHASRDEKLLDQLQQLPWVTFLLVKLVLEDQMTNLYKGDSCPRDVFDACRQSLWNTEKAPATDDARGSVYLMLRSLIQAQLPFQKKPTYDFLRWPALIARLDSAHPVRRQLDGRIGMEPEVFICVCLAVYEPVINGKMTISNDYFKSLGPIYGCVVDRFMSEFSRDLDGLRAELRKRLSARIAANIEARPKQESYEFPWLSNYPLLRDQDGNFVIWHPMVFARGMELAVHKRLSETENRPEYAGKFGREVFEPYVLELLQHAGLKYLSEQEYKKAVGNDKNAVEAIITSDGANVFIEAKMTAYSEKLTLSDVRPVVWTELKRVREAMTQGWEVSARLRDGRSPNWECAGSMEDFLIVVTSQQTSCATGEQLRRMFRPGTFDPDPARKNGPTMKQLEFLPLRNIVIVSIEEFEHLIGGVQSGEIDLVSFLREVAAANADPKTSIMFIDQMLGPKIKKWKLPRLLEDASQSAMERLAGVLAH
jgi:hypothetical protein